jgi:hypothetical protein
MDLFAKKYTVLIGNEPLTLWIKNNEVSSSKFMDKKINLSLDKSAIELIKDNPTRIINGNNLVENRNFTENVSKMMSSKLELAISKNDKKTMSRFARSDLVPQAMQKEFFQAVNRPNGLRGVISKAFNATNDIFQTMAKKIDRFFDKLNNKVVNQKLDPYLSKYQTKYVNQAEKPTEMDLKRHIDPKIMEHAEQFRKDAGIENNRFFKPFENESDRLLYDKYLEESLQKGFGIKDSSIAFQKLQTEKTIDNILRDFNDIDFMKDKINVIERTKAHKNETLRDFEILSKDSNPMDKIDILAKNKEYLNLSPEQQIKFEDAHIFRFEPLSQRAEELTYIHKVLSNSQVQKETIIDRTPTVDFLDKDIKANINQEWQKQQIINRENATPTRDFMNISAVKFNGVSKEALEKWAAAAKINPKVDEKVIDKFVESSLRNAKELEKIGVLKETSKDEFKFVDNYAKQALYNNIDKPVAQIQQANQGVKKEVEIDKKELGERVEHITSQESYQGLLNSKGEIDAHKLLEYVDKLQVVANALVQRENPTVSVTREDLQRADKAHHSMARGQENVR